MFRFLRDKFIGLGRDEDGAALVITLAFFMFLYVLFLGIWAVGTNVRTRIHLQNACDAAAYSAAVVQADTLSRIATINRAMSWTYVQMTRRQMDYIAYRWSEEAAKHWIDDYMKVISLRDSNRKKACVEHSSDMHFSEIQMFGASSRGMPGGTGYNVKSVLTSFDSAIGSGVADASIYAAPFHQVNGGIQYGIDCLGSQIVTDYYTIQQMGAAIENLKTSLPGNIDRSVEEVLEANLPESKKSWRHFCLPHSMKSYMREMQNNAQEERRFLSFSGFDSLTSAFESSGSDSVGWFQRKGHTDENGFRRGYNWGGNVLRAEWDWHLTLWTCFETPVGTCHVPTPYVVCVHPSHKRCLCTVGTTHSGTFHTGAKRGRFINKFLPYYKQVDSRSWADNDKLRQDYNLYYETPEKYRAHPWMLTPAYFGPAGTITVGLVADNQNPWSWLGNVAHQGLLSAFEPFVSKTFCVASAKAGYRNFNADASFGRDYRIDWRGENPDDPDDEENWNLYTSDWDAVMIPVPRAASQATDGAWGAMADAVGALAAKLGLSEDDFRAGGTHVYTVKFTKDDVENAYYWNQYLDLTVKDYVKRGAAVRAKWQIENPGRAISSWSELQKRMWH